MKTLLLASSLNNTRISPRELYTWSYSELELNKDEEILSNTIGDTSYFPFVFGDGVKCICYEDREHVTEVSDCYFSTYTSTTFIATKPGKVSIFAVPTTSLEATDFVYILKSSWSGEVPQKGNIVRGKLVDFEGKYPFIVNPLVSKITISSDARYTVYGRNAANDGTIDEESDTEKTFESVYLGVDIEAEQKTSEVDTTLKIDIKSDKKPDYFPEKIFEFGKNRAYTYNDPDYEFPKPDGLSGGAIAGIVIACVVVVAAIVFCVVWFLVLHKSCPCGGEKSLNY